MIVYIYINGSKRLRNGGLSHATLSFIYRDGRLGTYRRILFIEERVCFFRTGGGDAAVLPPQFFAKLRAKGQSEVLQALPVAEALQKLDQLGDDITRWQYS